METLKTVTQVIPVLLCLYLFIAEKQLFCVFVCLEQKESVTVQRTDSSYK